MRVYAVVLLLIAAAACSAIIDPYTPEEQSYLSSVNAQPLRFRVPKDQAEDVWSRINSWIQQYSSMKVQTASNYIIETYNPTNEYHVYGYSATRSILGADAEFVIKCIWGSPIDETKGYRNARILAYFARTGQVMSRFIDRQ